jgi:hypothetical protein
MAITDTKREIVLCVRVKLTDDVGVSIPRPVVTASTFSDVSRDDSEIIVR